MAYSKATSKKTKSLQQSNGALFALEITNPPPMDHPRSLQLQCYQYLDVWR